MIKRPQGFAFLTVLSFLVFYSAAHTLRLNIPHIIATVEPSNPAAPQKSSAKAEIIKPARVLYGIPTNSLEIVTGEIARGENISTILAGYNIPPATVYQLAQKARPVFNVKNIQAKRPYTLLHAPDSARTAQYFIYEPNEREYIIYDLRGELAVTRQERDVKTIERQLAGEIKGSLYESVLAAGGSAQLVNQLADIYAWRLDLNRIQPGDQFKLIFEEQQINRNPVGSGQLKAAFFEHNGQPLYAIGFDQGRGMGYFDQDGKSFKKAFLKEPLEYSRVSSRYNLNRFHPVQKRFKAHLGTDFAAPRGTPIRSVGDGVIVEAAYNRGNGYYVKIRHNKTYTTQYLHLSKFAKGMRPGKRVLQEQTIGYVGSTGLATGPHLCYRLWKNGRQVDALRVKLPLAEPVQAKNRTAFFATKTEIIKRMEMLRETEPKQDFLATGKAEPFKKS